MDFSITLFSFFGISIALIRRSHSATDSDQNIVTKQMFAQRKPIRTKHIQIRISFALHCDRWMDVLLDPISNVIISSFIRQAIQFDFIQFSVCIAFEMFVVVIVSLIVYGPIQLVWYDMSIQSPENIFLFTFRFLRY